eukprot:m.35898 g.35898  ORF g.35898 m.35898 type:complete len:511 (+) comp9938_c0_seq2:347-1879(+)
MFSSITRSIRNRRKAHSREVVTVEVVLPTKATIELQIERGCSTAALWEDLSARMQLPERDFFGLKYRKRGQRVGIWLNLDEKVEAQIGPPHLIETPDKKSHVGRSMKRWQEPEGKKMWTLQFSLKYYVGNDITDDWCPAAKELLFFQLKEDLSLGTLKVPEATAVTLAGLMLHAVEGPYTIEHDNSRYIENAHVFPMTTESSINEIQRQHKRCMGMITQQNAVDEFIFIAQHQEFYGVAHYFAHDDNDRMVQIGVSPRGIHIFENTDLLTVYEWSELKSVSNHGVRFSLCLLGEEEDCAAFKLSNVVACKTLWQTAVEHHTMFFKNSEEAEKAMYKLHGGSTILDAVQLTKERSRELMMKGSSAFDITLPTPQRNGSSVSVTGTMYDKGVSERQAKPRTYAVALDDSPDQGDGIMFHKGDLLTVAQTSGRVVHIVVGDTEVKIPSDFMLLLNRPPTQIVEVSEDFESSELTVKAGEIVVIDRQVSPDEVLVITQGGQGTLPVALLQSTVA